MLLNNSLCPFVYHYYSFALLLKNDAVKIAIFNYFQFAYLAVYLIFIFFVSPQNIYLFDVYPCLPGIGWLRVAGYIAAGCG